MKSLSNITGDYLDKFKDVPVDSIESITHIDIEEMEFLLGLDVENREAIEEYLAELFVDIHILASKYNTYRIEKLISEAMDKTLSCFNLE